MSVDLSRRRWYRPVLSALLLLLPVAAVAQIPGGDTLYLTSAELSARVLAGNPEVVLQRLYIERARAERLRPSFFPTLPELEYSWKSDAPFHNAGERGWEIALSQEIEIGGQYFLRQEAANAAVSQAEFETRAVELAIRAEAQIAFARLVAAESRLRLLDTLTSFARRLDTIAARLLEAQEISELDRNLIHIERSQAEIERITAESALLEARTELSRIMGIAPTVILAVAPTERGMIPPGAPDSLLSIAAAVERGDTTLMMRRPDWQALNSGAERLRLERDLAGRAWIPNVRVGVSVESETSILSGENLTGSSEIVREGFGVLQSTDRLLGLHVGVGVPLPFGSLYDLGQAERAIAETELAMVEAERRLLVARIRADVVGAARRLAAASRAYALYTRQIAPLVSRNLDLLERGYAAGELSASEIVTQQQQLLRAGEALIDAQQEYAEALAEFERITGQ